MRGSIADDNSPFSLMYDKACDVISDHNAESHNRKSNSSSDPMYHLWRAYEIPAFARPPNIPQYIRLRSLETNIDVGLQLWPAGFLLAEYLLGFCSSAKDMAKQQIIKNDGEISAIINDTMLPESVSQSESRNDGYSLDSFKIIELGTGFGLLPLLAALKVLTCKYLYASDYHNDVLENCKSNLLFNHVQVKTDSDHSNSIFFNNQENGPRNGCVKLWSSLPSNSQLDLFLSNNTSSNVSIGLMDWSSTPLSALRSLTTSISNDPNQSTSNKKKNNCVIVGGDIVYCTTSNKALVRALSALLSEHSVNGRVNDSSIYEEKDGYEEECECLGDNCGCIMDDLPSPSQFKSWIHSYFQSNPELSSYDIIGDSINNNDKVPEWLRHFASSPLEWLSNSLAWSEDDEVLTASVNMPAQSFRELGRLQRRQRREIKAMEKRLLKSLKLEKENNVNSVPHGGESNLLSNASLSSIPETSHSTSYHDVSEEDDEDSRGFISSRTHSIISDFDALDSDFENNDYNGVNQTHHHSATPIIIDIHGNPPDAYEKKPISAFHPSMLSPLIFDENVKEHDQKQNEKYHNLPHANQVDEGAFYSDNREKLLFIPPNPLAKKFLLLPPPPLCSLQASAAIFSNRRADLGCSQPTALPENYLSSDMHAHPLFGPFRTRMCRRRVHCLLTVTIREEILMKHFIESCWRKGLWVRFELCGALPVFGHHRRNTVMLRIDRVVCETEM